MSMLVLTLTVMVMVMVVEETPRWPCMVFLQ